MSFSDLIPVGDSLLLDQKLPLFAVPLELGLILLPPRCPPTGVLLFRDAGQDGQVPVAQHVGTAQHLLPFAVGGQFGALPVDFIDGQL